MGGGDVREKKQGKKREYCAKNKEKARALMLIMVQRLRCEILEPEMETADTTGR